MPATSGNPDGNGAATIQQSDHSKWQATAFTGGRMRRREAPLWMRMNRWRGLCWCGSATADDTPHCCESHAEVWDQATIDWHEFRRTVFERKGRLCRACGNAERHTYIAGQQTSNLTADHIIPIGLGGHCYDESNIQALCRSCHGSKTDADARMIHTRLIGNLFTSLTGNIMAANNGAVQSDVEYRKMLKGWPHKRVLYGMIAAKFANRPDRSSQEAKIRLEAK